MTSMDFLWELLRSLPFTLGVITVALVALLIFLAHRLSRAAEAASYVDLGGDDELLDHALREMGRVGHDLLEERLYLGRQGRGIGLGPEGAEVDPELLELRHLEAAGHVAERDVAAFLVEGVFHPAGRCFRPLRMRTVFVVRYIQVFSVGRQSNAIGPFKGAVKEGELALVITVHPIKRQLFFRILIPALDESGLIAKED